MCRECSSPYYSYPPLNRPAMSPNSTTSTEAKEPIKLPLYITFDSEGDVTGSFTKAELIQEIRDEGVDEEDRIFLVESITEIKFTQDVKLVPVTKAPTKKRKKK